LTVPCLLLFAVGVLRRLRSASVAAEGWGWVGTLGAALMIATFGATVAVDVVFTAQAGALASLGATALVLWNLKVALFTVNLAVLSTVVLAFGAGCRTGGVGPRWLATLAVVAAPLGLAAALPMRAVVTGSPVSLLGLICFLVWLLFVTVTSIGHLKGSRR
jgi:hypothetical protein